jgi:hypothetical protein
MIPLDAFSPDYQTARLRFRSMVAERGWTSEKHPINAEGFAEGELSIDVARVGQVDARRLIIISSGIHGTEAPFGSAVQLAWIDSLPRFWEPPSGCAVMLIHCLNPYGFTRIRRANEENVDLNRNFLAAGDFDRWKKQTVGEFAPLDPFMHPPRPPARFDWTYLIFAQMRVRLGHQMLATVLPAGQYAYPKGIFYGGGKPANSTRVVMNEMPRWIGESRAVAHLDFHTGLGRFADHRLLLSDPDHSEQAKIARRIFGQERVEPDTKTPGGYHNRGDMGEWLSRTFSERNYVYLCAEFGTYGSIKIIGALRRENQAHFWEDKDSYRYLRVKSETLNAFVPISSAWRWTTIRDSLDLIQSALKSCAFSASD